MSLLSPLGGKGLKNDKDIRHLSVRQTEKAYILVCIIGI